jgi:hypothetical protein
MRICKYIVISLLTAGCVQHVAAQGDTISFRGQLSAYSHYNRSNEYPLMIGVRYIPQVNYGHRWHDQNLIDLEASLNIFGNAALRPFNASDFSGDIKPYRAWLRYSTNQFELRAGLQKINFGSASLLRPLMWFDQIDPRDPLKLTDGVWGVLARYYFLNNTNIWLWGLYGNENLKGWESLRSKMNIPEFGGRLQFPIPKGETGLSYHHRVADGSALPDSLGAALLIPENRFGFDAKFDMVLGWWIEASWSVFEGLEGNSRNQEIINLGADYTFAIGNGLTIVYEHLLASADRKAFELKNLTTFSLMNLSYPLSMFDNLGVIVYYDWTNHRAYNFLTWQRDFRRVSFYLMGYLNPRDYYIPTQGYGEMLYAGSGIQVMLVFNH